MYTAAHLFIFSVHWYFLLTSLVSENNFNLELLNSPKDTNTCKQLNRVILQS